MLLQYVLQEARTEAKELLSISRVCILINGNKAFVLNIVRLEIP